MQRDVLWELLQEVLDDLFGAHAESVFAQVHKFKSSISRETQKTPNDPKLSDRRSWRGLCAVGVALLVGMEAQAVTAEPVRWSAWLGVAGLLEKAASIKILPSVVGKIPFGVGAEQWDEPNKSGVVKLGDVMTRRLLANLEVPGNLLVEQPIARKEKQQKLMLWFGAVCVGLWLCRCAYLLYLAQRVRKARREVADLRSQRDALRLRLVELRLVTRRGGNLFQ